jgi:hypothetical protein
MSSHELRLAALNERIAAIDEEVAACDSAFTELAAAFSTIDGTDALKRASQLEIKLDELRRERSLVVAAGKAILEHAKNEQVQREQEERRAVLDKARKISDGIVTLNSELDTALVALRELFERRADLFHQLGGTGLVDSVTINRLSGKGPTTRAACAANLHRYLDLTRVAQGSFVSLSSTNVVLMGVGRDVAPASTNGRGFDGDHHEPPPAE